MLVRRSFGRPAPLSEDYMEASTPVSSLKMRNLCLKAKEKRSSCTRRSFLLFRRLKDCQRSSDILEKSRSSRRCVMEDVKAQLALLTRVVTDLQKVVLELKAGISAMRNQSALPKVVEPHKAVETRPATASTGPEIPDEPWTDAEAKNKPLAASLENICARRRRLLRKRISLPERRSSCSLVYL